MDGVTITFDRNAPPKLADFIGYNCGWLKVSLFDIELPGVTQHHQCFLSKDDQLFGIFEADEGAVILLGCEFPPADDELPGWLIHILHEYIAVAKRWGVEADALKFCVRYTYHKKPIF